MITILTSLIPILIIILIAATVSGVGKSIQNARFLNGKVIGFLFAGYGALLVLSVIFSYTLPSEASETNTNHAQEIAEAFYANLHNGNLAEVEGVMITDEWNFPFEETALELQISQNDYYANVWVLVEEDDALTNEIRVSRYITPHVVSEIDYTHLIVAPSVELVNGTLTITPPEKNNLKLAQFHKEFTITQFTGEKMFPEHSNTWSANLLYLQVPAEVEISSDEYINLQYRQQ